LLWELGTSKRLSNCDIPANWLVRLKKLSKRSIGSSQRMARIILFAAKGSSSTSLKIWL
jgi:hypothetical protein